MSIEPHSSGQHPEPTSSVPHPSMALALAAGCALIAGYLTDWETAVTVFCAVVSLFSK